MTMAARPSLTPLHRANMVEVSTTTEPRPDVVLGQLMAILKNAHSRISNEAILQPATVNHVSIAEHIHKIVLA